jgi:outer membrane protein OmpA-like peptidoglycan-associated protein
MRSGLRGIVALVALAALLGCTTTNPVTGEGELSKTTKGAGLGALAGAAIGALAGGGKGALIGAGIGALAGGAVGNYMDRQEDKLRAQLSGTGVSVTRQGDNLVLNMPGDVTFDSDSSDIKPDFYEVLRSVAIVLGEFEKTSIHISGYTDSTGTFKHNFALSERRAQSVGAFLASQGIHRGRVFTQGKGPEHPIAPNDTPLGRQMNRRVELVLVPNTG